MGVKKVVLAAVVLALVMVASLNLGKKETRKLQLFTWSNYFSDPALQEFTRRTGIEVELTYMSSNEELLAKLRAGATGFDVIQPSDYMVRQMRRQGMLRELDASQLPNLSHLDEAYRNPPYDPGNKYSVPFTWGTTGIAVNTERVKVPQEIGWAFLLNSPDPQHTSLLDDMREVFAAVLKFQGHSINTLDPHALDAAKKQIADVKQRILMFTSEPKAMLLKEELTVAHIYSCDAAQAQKENPNIRYYLPKEGGTLWTDNFAIPVGAPNPQAAHAFINYILDPDVAVTLVREKQLATPNKTARLKLTPQEQVDPAIYPVKSLLDTREFLDDLGEGLQLVSRLWTELKS